MDDVRQVLHDLGASVDGAISKLRKDVREGFEAQGEAIQGMQRANDEMQRANQDMQRANQDMQRANHEMYQTMARQQHIWDETLAEMQEHFNTHRGNVAMVIGTYVQDTLTLKEEVDELKAADKAILKRVVALEERKAS